MVYRFRVYPTEAQVATLNQTFGAVRFVYNWALRERTDAFYERKERISYHQSSAMFTKLRNSEEFPWLKDVPYVPAQQALRHLQTAYESFFAKRTKYPKFKRKHDKQSAEYTSSAFRWRDGKLYLAKMTEPLDVVFHRKLDMSKVATITVSRDKAGRYFASMRFVADVEPLSEIDTSVGLDMGISSLVALSTGEKITNPRHLAKLYKRLAKAQRRLSRKQAGSNRREKARLRVAKLHAKIADSRKDFLHKLSHRLVNENQVIVVEDLNVAGMLCNHNLAKHIADASWSTLVQQLEYKCTWYGRSLVKIDRWYPSSKRCGDCGHVVRFLPLSAREWACPECGVVHDRDVNAARNILAVGHTVTARGGGVRPRQPSVSKATPDEARSPRLWSWELSPSPPNDYVDSRCQAYQQEQHRSKG